MLAVTKLAISMHSNLQAVISSSLNYAIPFSNFRSCDLLLLSRLFYLSSAWWTHFTFFDFLWNSNLSLITLTFFVLEEPWEQVHRSSTKSIDSWRLELVSACIGRVSWRRSFLLFSDHATLSVQNTIRLLRWCIRRSLGFAFSLVYHSRQFLFFVTRVTKHLEFSSTISAFLSLIRPIRYIWSVTS